MLTAIEDNNADKTKATASTNVQVLCSTHVFDFRPSRLYLFATRCSIVDGDKQQSNETRV